ncbi:uncharacterized protein [Diadema antillarum]|uniref:uncharacterized protein n=1 Tax=Diadema antillarum TaxID=105358 RepID=UPI003A865702
MASVGQGAEVIYKGWLKKAVEPEADSKKKNFLNRHSSSWKKRYVVLLRETDDGQDAATVLIFDKEVGTNFDKPKSSLRLAPYYRVDKRHDPTGKQHIFELHTPKVKWRFLADSQMVMDLWVFYLQIQTKLRADFPGRCFEVNPDNSESMRRIGARASKCLLHLSKWGMTLAIKRTRSVVAQWPLKSIREFESSETGRFSFKAGRNAPMGEAEYDFATLPGQDGEIYDLLDTYTTEDIGNQGEVQARPSAEEINQDYERLRLATFGLLPRRGSQARATSPTPHSAAVPVPGSQKVYDRLDRSRNGSKHRLDRTRSEQAQRTQPPPVVPPRVPSLPQKVHHPRGATPSLSQDYNFPYTEMDEPGKENLPYTEMGAGSMSGSSTLTRAGLGRDSKDRASWDRPIPRTLTQSTAASDRSSYQSMDFTPQSYRNTLTQNYENTPLIGSPSPKGLKGIGNEGYEGSPVQVTLADLKPQDHSYYMVETKRDASARAAEDKSPPSPLIHTYFEGGFQEEGASSAEREHFYQGVDPAGAVGGSPLARSISVDNMRSPSITDSYIDRSPTLGSLDLAFAFSPANPDWVNSRELPSLPRDAVPPLEDNPYILSPEKTRYAYEEVNTIFPPTPAQDADQTSYAGISDEAPPQEISIQGHVIRNSTFSVGYVDAVTTYEDMGESVANTARLVHQVSAHQAETGVLAPGVVYSQVAAVSEMDGNEMEPAVKRKSFKARTLERVKMIKSKSLVDLSKPEKPPSRSSVALEDVLSKREHVKREFKHGMKKSQSNPDLLSEQSHDIAMAPVHFDSPQRSSDKQNQVSGVRRKFGLGLKMMRQKSRSRDEEGESGEPKTPQHLKDVKGIAATNKTKSYSRRSQGQLSDLPADGAVQTRVRQGKLGGPGGQRQRAISAGSAAAVEAMLGESSNSPGMFSNPLASGSRGARLSNAGSAASDSTGVDEDGYLTPSEVGSPVKMLSDVQLEGPDMSDRPLPSRPLPSPPAHSQSAPLMHLNGRVQTTGEVVL